MPKVTWKNLDEVELAGVISLFNRTEQKYHDTKHFVISKVDNPELGWNID